MKMSTKNEKVSKKRTNILKNPSKIPQLKLIEEQQQKHNIRESFVRLERIDHQLVQFPPSSASIKQEYDGNVESREVQRQQSQYDEREEFVKHERIDDEVEYQSVDILFPTNAISNENCAYSAIERNDEGNGIAGIELELVPDEMIDIVKNEIEAGVDQVTLNALREEMMQVSREKSSLTKEIEIKLGVKKKNQRQIIKKPTIIVDRIRDKCEPLEIMMDGKRIFKCPLCEFTTTTHHRYRFENHFRVHTGERPFSCSHCNKTFSWNSNLIFHIRSKHPKETIHKCEYCRYKSGDADKVREHELKCENHRTFECVFCKYTKKDLRLWKLKIHVHKAHVRRVKTKCTIKVDPNKVKLEPLEILVDGTKKFKCPLCDVMKPTISRGPLNQHFLVHTDERRFPCPHCDKKYSRNGHLNFHIRSNHLNETIHKCTSCRYRSPDADKFSKHELKCKKRRTSECVL